MLPTRDPPQNKRPTQTESKGLEKIFQPKDREKKLGQQYLYQKKIDFKRKAINPGQFS